MIANNMFAQQTTTSSVTDSTGLPGDNFSLQGALEMFKQSKTPEDFEKKLNSKDNYVNNLDLNGDGKIDYVRVIDKTKGNAHAIILQVAINKTESQDVAVIEIEKQGKESAVLQIIGDEQLYGDSTYVEPVEAGAEKTKGAGPSASLSSVSMFFVNVWFWPCVTYIYEPVYVVYESPWYWGYYPYWWSPWYPMPWYRHHYYCQDYYYYGYRPVYVHHVTNAHGLYYGNRRTSPIVTNRYQNAHQQYQTNRVNQIHKAQYNNQVQGKPINQNQQMNNNQGKLNNNLESKGGNNNQSKTNQYENKPGINHQGKNINSYDNKPGNNYQSKPGNSNVGRNDNQYQSKPGNTYQSKPGNTDKVNHNNSNQSKPGNTYQSKPNNNVQGKPGNNTQVRPSNTYKSQPGNSSKSGNSSGTKLNNGGASKTNQGGGHSKTNSGGKSR
jgi:hypothetical protein